MNNAKLFGVTFFICSSIFLLPKIGYGKGFVKYRESIRMPPEIAEATTVSQIKSVLSDSDERMRITAVRRLGQIGDKIAIPLLLEVFKREPYAGPGLDAVPYVKEEVIEALEKIGGKESKKVLLKIFTDYLERGPNLSGNERAKFYWDGDYASVVTFASQSLYNIYNPKEDIEIYNFFKPIALGEIEDKFIMQNGDLRILVYKLYYKTEVFNKGLSKKDAIKYIKESTKPYTKDEGYGYESPGILSQKTVERSAKEELLREYAK